MTAASTNIRVDCRERMSNSQGQRTVENVALTLNNGPKKLVLGRYSNEEIVAQLRRMAKDPCDPEFRIDRIKPLFNQILKVRKAMTLTNAQCPRRKRKLQQFVRDNLSSIPALSSNSARQKSTKSRSKRQPSQPSSVSCVLNSVDSNGSSQLKISLDSGSPSKLMRCKYYCQKKQQFPEFHMVDESICWSPRRTDSSSVVDSDESVNGSNSWHTGNQNLEETQILALTDLIRNSNTLSLESLKQRHLLPPRRSIRLLNFISDHFQRMAIPVGPRFQADVPEWTEGNHENVNNEFENSKWLGTRIWPIEIGTMKLTSTAVGKGRPDSCSCTSPGTADCIRRHILEEKLFLQCDLGPAFFSWKFDEMGEQVSKSWNLKEQENFKALVRAKTMSPGKCFLKHAMRCFSHKSGKAIISYYFNVFIPRRMSFQTRSLQEQVDSDDDLVGNLSHPDLQKVREGKISIPNNSKDMKARYLRRPS